MKKRGFTLVETIAVVAIMAVIFSIIYSITLNTNRIYEEGMKEADIQDAARAALSRISESIKGASNVIAADSAGEFKDLKIDYSGMEGFERKLFVKPLNGEPYIYALKDNNLYKIILTANTTIVHKDYLISGDTTEAKFWDDFIKAIDDWWANLVTHEDKYKYEAIPYSYENVNGIPIPYIDIDGNRYYISLDVNYTLEQVNRKALYEWEGNWLSGNYVFSRWEDDYFAKASRGGKYYNINLVLKPDEYSYDSYKKKQGTSAIKALNIDIQDIDIEMESKNLFKVKVDIKEDNKNRTYYTAVSTRNYGGD